MPDHSAVKGIPNVETKISSIIYNVVKAPKTAALSEAKTSDQPRAEKFVLESENHR